MAALFELLGASIEPHKAPAEPGTIQWDFADAEPWHLVVANGDTRFEPGPRRAPDGHAARAATRTGRTCSPGASTRSGWPRARRLRPSGDFRWLWRARRMFPR